MAETWEPIGKLGATGPISGYPTVRAYQSNRNSKSLKACFNLSAREIVGQGPIVFLRSAGRLAVRAALPDDLPYVQRPLDKIGCCSCTGALADGTRYKLIPDGDVILLEAMEGEVK